MSNDHRCPDLATLLSAVDGDLSSDAYQDVAGHLEHCDQCRERLRTIDQAVVVGKAANALSSEAEAARASRFQQRLSEEDQSDERRRQARRRAALPAVLMTAAAVAGIAVVHLPSSQPINAEEVLARAIAAERRAPGVSHHVRTVLTPAAGILSHGQEPQSLIADYEVSDRARREKGVAAVGLGTLSRELQRAGLDVVEPLSASAFGAWCASVGPTTRRDHVTIAGDLFILHTAVANGKVRRGELRVERASYRVVGQAWIVDGVGRVESQAVSTSEGLRASNASDRISTPALAVEEARTHDALEHLELDARLVVSRLDPDGNVAITRRGSRVVVRGALASAVQRQSILDQLGARAGVDVNLSPGLSRAASVSGGLERWAERTFGETRAKHTFVKSLRLASHTVDRRLAGLDAIAQRYPTTVERALSPAASDKLRTLVAREYAALLSDLLLLDARLTPLGLGAPTGLVPAESVPPPGWRTQLGEARAASANLRAELDELLGHDDIPSDATSVRRRFDEVWRVLVKSRQRQ